MTGPSRGTRVAGAAAVVAAAAEVTAYASPAAPGIVAEVAWPAAVVAYAGILWRHRDRRWVRAVLALLALAGAGMATGTPALILAGLVLAHYVTGVGLLVSSVAPRPAALLYLLGMPAAFWLGDVGWYASGLGFAWVGVTLLRERLGRTPARA